MNSSFFSLGLTLFACFFSGCFKNEKPVQITPPIAKQNDHALELDGHKRIDPYYWMNEKKNPEVLDYLQKENEYAEKMMEDTKELQKTLYEEMVNRVEQITSSVPYQYGSYFYYTRYEKDAQYPIYCRKKDLESEEEILIDVNLLAKDKTYFSVECVQVSPNQKILAYAVDASGDEIYNLYFKDLENGSLLKDYIEGVVPCIEWANDNSTIFYSVYDSAKRPYQIKKYELGKENNNSVIFEEKDPTFRLGLGKTKDEKYILLTTRSSSSTEIYLIPSYEPRLKPIAFLNRQNDLEYVIEHFEDTFLILTNYEAKNFRLMTGSPGTDPSTWKTYIPYNKKIYLEGIDLFKSYIVLYAREAGLPSVLIYNIENKSLEKVPFQESDYEVYGLNNFEADLPYVRLAYSSPITPTKTYDYHFKTRELQLRKEQKVNDYDPTLYMIKNIYARGEDGAKIPVTLIMKKENDGKGPLPMLLTGYGAYGASYPAYFSSPRFSLIDRGYIYGIAHIRGGSEYGISWYENGRRLQKKNTFTDFIACIEAVINEGYTKSEILAIEGRSAGGLLMGAVTNMRPDLFKVMIAGVPFVDVITTMSDPEIPLTVNEYEEWGNPSDPKYYEYMLSYSPYDNVKKQNYPAMLITAGYNDPRVAYWEPAKWVAKLRANKTNHEPLLFKTFMGAGHYSSSGRFDVYKDKAFEYAFILTQIGNER